MSGLPSADQRRISEMGNVIIEKVAQVGEKDVRVSHMYLTLFPRGKSAAKKQPTSSIRYTFQKKA
jgi:hypothetical protein